MGESLHPEKLRSIEEIRTIAESYRSSGRKVVATSGVFDVIHPGHVHCLKTARQQGNVLILCINSDESVARLKGQDRPFFNQNNRAYILSNLNPVDHIVIFAEDDPRNILSIIKPAIYVKSREGYKGLEGEVVKSGGGQIVLIDDVYEVGSSTEVIDYITRIIEETNKRFLKEGSVFS